MTVVSFSGGRTSAMMSKLIKDNWQDVKFVFANTGEESEETLEFVDKCDKYFGLDLVWVEAVIDPRPGKGIGFKVVDFETASRKGEPFEAFIAKYGIPNQASPECSRSLKKYPIEKWMKSIGWKCPVAIGIRSDEPKRLNWKKVKAGKVVYPLATVWKATKYDVNKFWSMQPFDLEIKSYEGNCRTCWKKSFRKLMTIAIENPSWFESFREWEIKYGEFTPEARKHNARIKPPHHFFRGDRSVDDIFEEAEFPFDLAIDESKILDSTKMLMNWDAELDGDAGCSQSCEAF